jgi:hypothetical protein
MRQGEPAGKFWRFLIATCAGVGLGLAITIGRLFYLAPSAEDQLMAALDRNPVFQVAIKASPSRREEYLARLKAAYRQGGNEGSAIEARAIGREIGLTYASTLLASASDAALSDFLSVTTEYLAYAYEHDPEGCYAYARGMSDEIASAGLPPTISARLADAMLAVIDTATRNPVRMSDEEWRAGSAKGEEIRARIAQSAEADSMYFGDYAGKPATTTAERKGTCLFLTRVYQQIQRADAPLRFQILRAMSGKKRHPEKVQHMFKDRV